MITGGSAGLGEAYANHLADRGFDLILVARDQERLAVVAEGIGRRTGVIVEIIGADLTDARQRAVVERRVADPERPVNLLVNNAGVECHDRFDRAPLSDLTYEVDLNIVAVMCLTRAALPAMMSRGNGDVVNVASFSGYLPASGSAYSATKAWVMAFTDTVSASLSGTSVRVVAVCAGRILARQDTTTDDAENRRRSPLWLDPSAVVKRSMADLQKGRVLSTPGWIYRMVVTYLEAPRRSLRLFAKAAGKGRERLSSDPEA